MKSHDSESFEALPIPRKELSQLAGRYRVYKDATDFIMVEAASALEALKACGLPQVYRIERDAIYLNNVLNSEALSNTPPAAAALPSAEIMLSDPSAPAVPPPPAQETAPAVEPTVAAAAVAAPLTGEQVDKLLQP